jgi:hypothetical protein
MSFFVKSSRSHVSWKCESSSPHQKSIQSEAKEVVFARQDDIESSSVIQKVEFGANDGMDLFCVNKKRPRLL